MEFGSGSDRIGTKRAPVPEHALERALERASALERALEFANEHTSRRRTRRMSDASEPLALTHERARVLTRERTVALERTRVLQPKVVVPQNQPFDLDAVLADSDIMHIINSIESYHRFQLARVLWLYSSQTKHKYSWLFHFITPITRLPPELLQQILLIVIDEVSDSPSVLVHVCKHWHSIVTGFWASLKLGTKTTNDHVIRKLEGS